MNGNYQIWIVIIDFVNLDFLIVCMNVIQGLIPQNHNTQCMRLVKYINTKFFRFIKVRLAKTRPCMITICACNLNGFLNDLYLYTYRSITDLEDLSFKYSISVSN